MWFSDGITISIDAHNVQILQCYLLDSFFNFKEVSICELWKFSKFFKKVFLILINMKKPVSIISKYNITGNAKRVLWLN